MEKIMIIKNLTFNSKNISFQVDDINEKEKIKELFVSFINRRLFLL